MKKIFSNKPLVIVILFALVARLYIAFGTGLAWFSVDSVNYINQANELLAGRFGLYFPNGYPVIIALLTLITGSEHSDISLIILNIFLSICSVYIFWLTCKRNLGASIFSLLAVLLFAFYPNQLNYVRLILTEVPALFFLMLSFYFLGKESLSPAALSIGIAATIKTALIPIILFFAIYLLYKMSYAKGLKYLGLAMIPLSAMMIYGLIITGVFTLGYSSIHNFYLTVDQSGLKSTNAGDAIAYYLNFAFSHPIQFILERLDSLWEFWGFLPSSNEGLRENFIFRLLIGIRFPLLLLAIYGFWITEKNYLAVFSAITIISLTILHFIFYSIPRYNFVAEPFLIFLAAAGLGKIIDNMKKKKNILIEDS